MRKCNTEWNGLQQMSVVLKNRPKLLRRAAPNFRKSELMRRWNIDFRLVSSPHPWSHLGCFVSVHRGIATRHRPKWCHVRSNLRRVRHFGIFSSRTKTGRPLGLAGSRLAGHFVVRISAQHVSLCRTTRIFGVDRNVEWSESAICHAGGLSHRTARAFPRGNYRPCRRNRRNGADGPAGNEPRTKLRNWHRDDFGGTRFLRHRTESGSFFAAEVRGNACHLAGASGGAGDDRSTRLSRFDGRALDADAIIIPACVGRFRHGNSKRSDGFGRWPFRGGARIVHHVSNPRRGIGVGRGVARGTGSATFACWRYGLLDRRLVHEARKHFYVATSITGS